MSARLSPPRMRRQTPSSLVPLEYRMTDEENGSSRLAEQSPSIARLAGQSVHACLHANRFDTGLAATFHSRSVVRSGHLPDMMNINSSQRTRVHGTVRCAPGLNRSPPTSEPLSTRRNSRSIATLNLLQWKKPKRRSGTV